MCGICGVVALDRPPERETVDRMLDELAHRGPDGRGVFDDDGVCLGHLRLAIIDLSDAGLQPFASDDGRLQLAPQRRDLQLPRAPRRARRPAGHRFRSDTDTEVILAAYREWGEALRRALQRHVGVRALGRGAAHALLLARPLRRQALLLPPRRRPVRVRERAVDARAASGRRRTSRAVRDYLEQGYLDHGDETFFAGRAEAAARALAHVRAGRPPARALLVARAARRRPADPVAAVRETLPRRGPAASCAATSRSAPASRAGSTPRRSPPPSPHHRPRPPEDASPPTSRTPGFDERPVRPRRRRADRRGGALGLVHGRRPRREPARDRRRRRASRSARPRSAPAWYVMREAAQRAG